MQDLWVVSVVCVYCAYQKYYFEWVSVPWKTSFWSLILGVALAIQGLKVLLLLG